MFKKEKYGVIGVIGIGVIGIKIMDYENRNYESSLYIWFYDDFIIMKKIFVDYEK